MATIEATKNRESKYQGSGRLGINDIGTSINENRTLSGRVMAVNRAWLVNPTVYKKRPGSRLFGDRRESIRPKFSVKTDADKSALLIGQKMTKSEKVVWEKLPRNGDWMNRSEFEFAGAQRGITGLSKNNLILFKWFGSDQHIRRLTVDELAQGHGRRKDS